MTGPTPPDDLSFEDPGLDALDTAIGERLRAAAPTAPNVDATLAGLRPGFTRARRRHQVVLAGAAALCVAAFVGIGAVALQSGGTGDVKTPPATRPDTTTTAPTLVPTTVPMTPPTAGDTLPGGITPGTVDDHGGGSNSGPGGGDDSGSGSSGSGSSGSGSGSSGSGSGSSGTD
jgi:uncharacterized membrane protein YgcG